MGEKRSSETHIIPLLFDASNNKGAIFKIFGDDYPTPDGTCIRDYVHVVDIAEAHVKGLNKILKDGGKHIYNLGTGRGYSVKEIILIASAEKARKELKWIPQYSDLKTIIKSAHNWHKKIN